MKKSPGGTIIPGVRLLGSLEYILSHPAKVLLKVLSTLFKVLSAYCALHSGSSRVLGSSPPTIMPVGDVNMTPIFCQKGNEKSGLTPLQKKTSSPLLIDVGVDSSLLWITIVSKEPQIIMATCLITLRMI